MKIEIIEYKNKYAKEIIKFCNEFQDFLVSIDPEKRLRRGQQYGAVSLRRKTKNSETAKTGFFLALDGEKAIGFVFGSVNPAPSRLMSLSGKKIISGTIEELYVAKNYRNKGVGRALIRRIEDFFKKQKCEYLNISVFAFNDVAYKTYKKSGYKDRGIWMSKKLK